MTVYAVFMCGYALINRPGENCVPYTDVTYATAEACKSHLPPMSNFKPNSVTRVICASRTTAPAWQPVR
jgi:hypothetical protein